VIEDIVKDYGKTALVEVRCKFNKDGITKSEITKASGVEL
jgi:hypothetical protein